MKKRISKWLSRKNEKVRREQYETMPDFRKVFAQMPNMIKAPTIPGDAEPQNTPSVQDRAAAKSVVEQETKAAASKNKVDEICARIESARRKNLEIIWLLQTDRDVPFKSLNELIQGCSKEQNSGSIKGISVNYAYEGRLHEISPLTEEELDLFAKKLTC